jgi:hypothetical protein
MFMEWGELKPEFQKEAHIRYGIMILPPRTFLNGMESWTTYKLRQTKMKTVQPAGFSLDLIIIIMQILKRLGYRNILLMKYCQRMRLW